METFAVEEKLCSYGHETECVWVLLMSSLCLCGSNVSKCHEMPSVDCLECFEVAHDIHLPFRMSATNMKD